MRASRHPTAVVLLVALVLFFGGVVRSANAAESADKKPATKPEKKPAEPRPETAPTPKTPPQPQLKDVPKSGKAKEIAPAPTARVEPSVPRHEDAVGPGGGQGERKIEASATDGARPTAEADKAGKASKAEDSKPNPVAVKKGKAPKRPLPTAPDGALPSAPDDDGRRQVAGGATAEDLVAAKPDPELREMRDAERVLFPKPLHGARSGWSWDFPASGDDGTTVVASGLPPTFPSVTDKPSDVAKDADFLKALAMPNLPTRLDARVVKYLKFYRDDPRGRNILRTWAKKAGRLSPALRAELAKAGLPTDLVWLSLIESGHNPTIVSPAGAAGLWQFIPESARLYGLTVDRWVDERLDPQRSTEAAVRYLSDLRTRFGSWELAMAAYNMGHGGLLRTMRKYNTNDFWALCRYEAGLPWETTLYVPKILATAIVMMNKKAFGIDDIEQDPPLSFDTVSVPPGMDLADVARAADIGVEDVRSLNAQYVSGRTPPQSGAPRRWPVRVPAGRGLVCEQRLASTTPPRGPLLEPHVVRLGDTVETVAREHGALVRDVAQLNHVAEGERLTVGSVVLVPVTAQSADPDKGAPDEEVVVVPARRFGESARKRVFYRVVPGDQIAEVAAALGSSPSELAAWNAIDPAAQLQAGMTLQVYVRPDQDLSRVRVLREHECRLLVAGTSEFFDYFEAQNGRKRLTVTAKKGDSYASIGRRYGMSAPMMERINRVPASTELSPGNRVVVYTKGEATERGPSAEPDLATQLAAIVAPMPDALPSVPSFAEGTPAPRGQGQGQRSVTP